MPAKQDSIVLLDVNDLQLDDQNPRLPEEKLGMDQKGLLAWLEEEETLDELAASMLANGFFVHEPLVVIRSNGTPAYTVVEGNRRFATLNILLQLPAAQSAGLEFEFEKPPNSKQLADLRNIPCLIVDSADEVRKFLGFRHIGGLKTWSPEAKARYLETEIDFEHESGSLNPFRTVGRRVGSNALGVRGPYVALKILRVAKDDFGISSASYVLRYKFGVWTRLLNSQEVRNFIGFEDPTSYAGIHSSLKKLDATALTIVLDDMQPRDGRLSAVLQDSRDATKYGRVIANDVARSALHKHNDLELAHEIVDRTQISSRLVNLTRTIDVLIQGIDGYEITDEVVAKARSLSASARSLAAIVADRVHEED
ncbi:ParB N-terminal domain-containing protein [Pseudarthrobacter enclensis]|uniref:ParB N-terminal domain-containing protein n=1 Tax=Pseudarthrobacter enclensis TaxID=993070 RepID=UPI003EE114A2